ncbi:hypothetical protein GUITHDRAFT_155497 [Guillardia theta CCMP2712]|uniref:Uncharacterized protein n=2 Tax=Guillardia theta TaxID=55529 RepID=L1IHI6_GUITC|nr:hypothetical protein GUITHDRAFT_155497 [Guillardia theta CCMP2712]EKX35379.1 hypothetical protein GUITHDRAFT_155497 [Guillardia theta CCMP2712]|eukprot:XP_005822359.1 hypothetical protein GUITHDRAFT_155497 [Guillardia theta CCMP2712]
MAFRCMETVAQSLHTFEEESLPRSVHLAEPANEDVQPVGNKKSRAVLKDDFEQFYGMNLCEHTLYQGNQGMECSRNRRASSGSLQEKQGPSPLNRRFSCYLGQSFSEDHDVLTSASKDNRLLEILQGLAEKNVVEKLQC